MVNSTSKDSGRKLFYGLFIFPLLIAVGMAVLLCTVVLLTKETETPESLISSIKTGTPSKRWQKAFELSNELNQGRGMLRSSGVMKEIIHILNRPEEYDPKTRSYMAMALSHFEEQEASDALMKALQAESDADVQLFLLWSLGIKQAGEAEGLVLPFLDSERSDLKKMAAYVLGVIGSAASVKSLQALLDDPERDVRWNSALSLARLGDNAGYSELLTMLDRETLEADGGFTAAKIEEVMIGAIKGIVLLGRNDALPYLEDLSREEKSLKVRQAALEAMKYFKSPKGIAA